MRAKLEYCSCIQGRLGVAKQQRWVYTAARQLAQNGLYPLLWCDKVLVWCKYSCTSANFRFGLCNKISLKWSNMVKTISDFSSIFLCFTLWKSAKLINAFYCTFYYGALHLFGHPRHRPSWCYACKSQWAGELISLILKIFTAPRYFPPT